MSDPVAFDALLQEPFPDTKPASPNVPKRRGRWRLRGRRKFLALGAGAVLLVAGAGGVWAATGSGAAEYRWAVARTADVDQTLNSYGTVKPINAASVSFPVSGTIATVPVSVGQHVTAGQTLATIDTTSLQGQLDSARSTLATAQAKLVTDSEAQASGTATATSSTGSGSTTLSSALVAADTIRAVPVADRSRGGDGTAGQQAVKDAQAKLLADQQKVDTPAPTPSLSPPASASAGIGNGSAGAGFGGSGSSGGGFSSSSAGGSGTSSSGGRSSGGTVTAADLAVDQAEVDAAQANVTVAEQALKQATLLSPIAGDVAQVSVKPGSAVSSGGVAVIVIGKGNDEVVTSVGDLDLDKIHIGSSATVIPDGGSRTVSGTVTAIGLLPASTSSGTTSSAASSSSSGTSTSSGTASSSASYPVTISLDTGGLYTGSGADVSILIKRAKNVVSVPTSAVSSFGSRHLVTVLSGGKAQRRIVDVGAIGPTLTQVTSGLKAGEKVVLAQLNTPLPTGDSTSGFGRRFGGGSGLTGGSLTGGGGISGGGISGGRFRSGSAGGTRG